MDWNNPHEACEEYRRLDSKFGTTVDSPLHHDHRCKLNHSNETFIADHFQIIHIKG